MFRRVSAIVVAAIAGTAAAQSGTVQYLGQDYPGAQPGGVNNGGVFSFRLTGDLAQFGDNGTDVLATFCLEIGEFVGNGRAQVNTKAISGGRVDDGDGTDALDLETAFLFTQFKAGLGGAFADDFSSYDSQRAMQLAIWHFEESLGQVVSSGSNDTLDLAATGDSGFASTQTIRDLAADYINAAAFAVANGDWTDLGKVRVLNIERGVNDNPWDGQDMLVMIPLPHASALAGLGLLAVGTRRRRATI